MVRARRVCDRLPVGSEGDKKGRPGSSRPPTRRASGPVGASLQSRPTTSYPPPRDDASTAARGAKNVINACLRVTPGERVHVMTYRADALFATFARAIEDAGATTVAIDLVAFDPQATVDAHVRKLGPLLAGATASILIAPERPSAALSMAVAKAAEKEGARHIHLLAVDERMLGQSVRADPDLLAIVNKRLGDALRPPSSVRATSEFGTDLEARLALTHPILSSIGRPERGASENLPAGVVYLHPARVSGTFVVDRAIFGPGITLDRALLRRAPARIELNGNRMTDFTSQDPKVTRTIETYLASHADAGRIGMLLFPTNYLVRSDVGSDRQDMLLPGMGLSMGFSSQATTGANYEAPVQMVLLGRRQTVEVGGKKLVDGGRLADFLVEGIDPFR